MTIKARLESKPWAKIYPVRRFCATSADFDMSSLSETTVADYCGESDVLAVYVLLHTLHKVVGTLQRRTRLPFSQSDQLPNTNALRTIMNKLPAHYLHCHRMFQLLMHPLLQACVTQALIS